MRDPDPALLRDLGRALAPARVLSRPLDRLARSADASIYRLVPEVVVRPRGLDEVRGLLACARRHRRGITFRTAGTSLSGQAVTDQILVELAHDWGHFRILDDGARIWSQPGVVGGHLNRRLAPHARRLGSDPASIDACMIGGIVANNSSGMCCGTEQNAYRMLEAMTFMLADGTVVDTARPDADERLQATRPELHAALLRLRDRVRADDALCERIGRRFALKNTTGYSLRALLEYDRPSDILAHLMVGSEGTLGFVADVTLRTVPDPPLRATALLYFAELREAGAAVAPLTAAGAVAQEIMDAASLRSQAEDRAQPFAISDRTAALLVEMRESDAAALDAAVARALAALEGRPLLAPPEFTRDPAEREAQWRLRKGLFPAVGGMRPPGTAVVIEDVAVPPARLAEAIDDLRALFGRHGFDDAIVFGHARDGNLHFVFARDFARPDVVAAYDAFMRALAEMITVRYDGSLKAEHGSGRNMAPFVRDEWGDEAYALMWRIKRLLDPDGILNPGVLLSDDPEAHLRHLKPLTVVSPIVDKCIECGFCEPRCPSRDLTLSPRRSVVAVRGGAPAGLGLRGRPGGGALRPRGLRVRGRGHLRGRLDVPDVVPREDRHGPADQGDALARAHAGRILGRVVRRGSHGRGDRFRSGRAAGGARAERGPWRRETGRVGLGLRTSPGAGGAPAPAGRAGPAAARAQALASAWRGSGGRRVPELSHARLRLRRRRAHRIGRAGGGGLRGARAFGNVRPVLRHAVREQGPRGGRATSGRARAGRVVGRVRGRTAGDRHRRVALRGHVAGARAAARFASPARPRLPIVLGRRGPCASSAGAPEAARGAAPDVHAREERRPAGPDHGRARLRRRGVRARGRRVLRVRRRQGLPGARAHGGGHSARGGGGGRGAGRARRVALFDLPHLRDRDVAGGGAAVPLPGAARRGDARMMLDRFLDWLVALPAVPAFLVLMVLSAMENVFPPVPADVAVVLGAFLARRGGHSAALIGLLCWATNTASSAALYFYARAQGRGWLDVGWAARLVPPEAVRALETAYVRHGVLGIFLSRFLPGVRAAVTPFAGVMGVGPWRALLPASIASAIWYAVLIVIGSTLGLNWDAARRLVDDMNRVLGVVALVVTLFGVRWLWKRRRAKPTSS